MSNNDRRSRHKKIAIYLGVIIPILAIVVSIIVWRCPYPPPTPDFSISVDPMKGEVQQDGVIQTTITVKGINGYEYNVSLSASGQPSDVVVAFAPPMGGPTPTFTSNVMINVGSDVPVGGYEITIKGMGADGKEHNCNYVLTVKPTNVTPDFSISVDPMKGEVQQDGVIQMMVTVTGIHEYKHPISLSSSGQPSGVVVIFSPSIGEPTPSYNSAVTINVDPSVSADTYTIIIKGTGEDGKEHSCNYILTITPPPPPEIEITYPHDNDTVEISETVEGTSQNIPEGQVIWIVVYPHPVDRYYPYNDPADIQVNGEWASLVVIGVEEDAGMKFDIIAVLADESAQDTFDAYLKQAEATNNWSGLDALPPGAVIYGHVTVTRK